LAVLLSISVVFLCGVVFIYVANTNDVKQDYEKLKGDYDILQASKNVTVQKLDEQKLELTAAIDELKNELATVNAERESDLVALKNAQNTAVKWQDRVNGLSGLVSNFEQTISEMHTSLESTRKSLQQEQERNLKMANMLNDKTVALDESIVQVQLLEAEKRRLLEQKAAIEKLLDAGSKEAKAVTVVQNRAMPAGEQPYAVVTGLVTEVSESLIGVSIGTADGIKKGVKLHVTRGNTFVCDLTITDADVDKAAGMIGLKNDVPRIGDTVSTEL
jgi:hypothetical protein